MAGSDGSGATSDSLGSRLLNVFVTPSQVFENLKGRPVLHSNWLVPTVMVCLASIISALVVFSQPAVLQQINEQKHKAMEKRLEKLPPEQRQEAIAVVDKFSSPLILKIIGSVQGVFGGFTRPLIAALLIWLGGLLLFKADLTYLKALEATGMAGMIVALGIIISMLLVVITGNIGANLNALLFIRDVQPGNLLHMILGVLNILTLWYLVVLTIALARLTSSSVLISGLWVFGIWTVFQVGLIIFSWGAQRLVGGL